MDYKIEPPPRLNPIKSAAQVVLFWGVFVPVLYAIGLLLGIMQVTEEWLEFKAETGEN